MLVFPSFLSVFRRPCGRGGHLSCKSTKCKGFLSIFMSFSIHHHKLISCSNGKQINTCFLWIQTLDPVVMTTPPTRWRSPALYLLSHWDTSKEHIYILSCAAYACQAPTQTPWLKVSPYTTSGTSRFLYQWCKWKYMKSPEINSFYCLTDHR